LTAEGNGLFLGKDLSEEDEVNCELGCDSDEDNLADYNERPLTEELLSTPKNKLDREKWVVNPIRVDGLNHSDSVVASNNNDRVGNASCIFASLPYAFSPQRLGIFNYYQWLKWKNLYTKIIKLYSKNHNTRKNKV
jgi:hypothetical protein